MNHIRLFDWIAPMYAWFFNYQIKHYRRVLETVEQSSLDRHLNVLDVGCGTGALTRIWAEHFDTVVGIDGSVKMLDQAKRLTQDQKIEYRVFDLRQRWPYENQSFELVSASFVLHGLQTEERMFVLSEMKRVGRNVLIMDYREKTNPLISLVEWLEQGDYFRFRKQFTQEFQSMFKQTRIIDLHPTVGLYIAKQ